MTTKIKSGVISDNAITSAHISSGAISSAHLTSIDTDNITEGSSNLYFTTARARTSFSITDSGGDGSLAYDNSTGVITYTGPSAAEVRAHLSAGTGVTYSSGEFSIGQSVATTASPTFADINITGDLNLTGDINSYSVTDLDIVDQTITLGVGQNEAASDGSGIVIAGSSASILWDEPNDEFDFNKGINVTGNIAVSGTVDGVDIATRDAILTSTTTTAGAALPKAGGTITGTVVFNSAPTFNTAIAMGSSLNVATTVGIAGTTVIDSSRNLTNIGTIASGAIVADGNITADYNDTISLNYSVSNGNYHKGMTGTSFASGSTARGLHLFNFDNDSNLGINFWVGTTAAKQFAGRIDSSGNVGIGTTSPDANLEVRTTQSMAFTSDTVDSITIGTSGTNKPCIKFDTADTTHTNRVWAIENGAGGRLNFFRNGLDVLKLNQDGSIEMAGNVGIGTSAVTSPGLWYDATNDYLAISHWATPPTPAAMLHLSDNSNDLDVPQIRIEGRENPGDTTLDISVKDAGARLSLIEGPAGDASNGYGLMEFKTNAAVNVGYPTRGGFKFDTPASSNNLVITNTGDIGIDIATPRSKLSINSNGAPATSTGNMANTGLTIHDGTGGTAVQLGTYNAGSWGYIQSGYVNNATVAREFRIMNGANYTMTLSSTGNVGIGETTPDDTLHVNSAGGAARIRIGSGNDAYYTQKGYLGDTWVFGSGETGDVVTSTISGGAFTSSNTGGAFVWKIATSGGTPAETMRITNAGNLGLGTATPNNMSHTQNNSITATQSTGNSWSTPSSGGNYSVLGAIEASGIRNRHVAKWAFSGNLSANSWYPFTKRSQLASLTDDTGSSSEEGFGMYFRVYVYTSSSGWGEYFSSRVSSIIWVTNNGSNSNTAQELYIGPALGHAPNAGHDPDSATSCPVRMRIAHHYGSDSTWPADQTIELRVSNALSGLNSTVAGRQLMVYGYII